MTASAVCFACSGLLAIFGGAHLAWLLDRPNWWMGGYVVVYLTGAAFLFVIGALAKREGV